MKKINIYYWIVTIVFAAFMAFSAVPDIMVLPDATHMIVGLGYPGYFVIFIGVAKLLGVIAILLPNLYRIKEWAYAGLFFDLFAAFYSTVATSGFQPGELFFIVPIAFLFASYFLWHRKRYLKAHAAM